MTQITIDVNDYVLALIDSYAQKLKILRIGTVKARSDTVSILLLRMIQNSSFAPPAVPEPVLAGYRPVPLIASVSKNSGPTITKTDVKPRSSVVGMTQLDLGIKGSRSTASVSEVRSMVDARVGRKGRKSFKKLVFPVDERRIIAAFINDNWDRRAMPLKAFLHKNKINLTVVTARGWLDKEFYK
jgi:hypothetical protein